MKLEEQVAPLELCEQLPEDAFADSAFVWYYPYNEGSQWDLIPRSEAGKEPMYAAPTLQEILREMAVGDEIMESHSPELNYNRFCGGWIIRGRILNISVCDRIIRDWVDERDKTSPVTAALKLWLDLTKGGKDGK